MSNGSGIKIDVNVEVILSLRLTLITGFPLIKVNITINYELIQL
jgi:hypothetical protein